MANCHATVRRFAQQLQRSDTTSCHSHGAHHADGPATHSPLDGGGPAVGHSAGGGQPGGGGGGDSGAGPVPGCEVNGAVVATELGEEVAAQVMAVLGAGRGAAGGRRQQQHQQQEPPGAGPGARAPAAKGQEAPGRRGGSGAALEGDCGTAHSLLLRGVSPGLRLHLASRPAAAGVLEGLEALGFVGAAAEGM